MKRLNNLYYSICKTSNIRFIYDDVISKNTKNRKKVLNFDNYYIQNIMYIRNVLVNKSYIPLKYNIFLIREPKIRIIMSQGLYDKVINHLVSFYILKPALDHCLIDTNVATRKNKGTDYAIKYFKKYINIMKLKNNKFYVLKFDISKYFYNIDHNILKQLIKKRIKDKYALDIIEKIIDSTNQSYINYDIERLIKNYEINSSDKNVKIELNRLPRYRNGKGLPIGNMTSQILAIFYLNDLDHYIKEDLGIKYYIRYMDDGILIHKNKKYLQKCLECIRHKLLVDFKLELNSKTKIYSSEDQIEFLGFRYYLKDKKLIIRVKKSTKKKYKRRLKCLKNNDIKKYKCVVASYNGILKYANSKSLIYVTLKKWY